jgi:hypothetical protein
MKIYIVSEAVLGERSELYRAKKVNILGRIVFEQINKMVISCGTSKFLGNTSTKISVFSSLQDLPSAVLYYRASFDRKRRNSV